MTPEQIKLIKGSWSVVIIKSLEVGTLFYKRLFEIDPSLRPLFKGDIKVQAQKLINMVTLIVTKLEKLDQVMPQIKYLAKRHTSYGTKPEHYAKVGEALIWTLEKTLTVRWNENLKKAWIEVYTVLSSAMIENQKNG